MLRYRISSMYKKGVSSFSSIPYVHPSGHDSRVSNQEMTGVVYIYKAMSSCPGRFTSRQGKDMEKERKERKHFKTTPQMPLVKISINHLIYQGGEVG